MAQARGLGADGVRPGRLKTRIARSDLKDMAGGDLSCPICDADLLLAGDERVGDQVHCSFCGAQFLLRQKPERSDEWEVEEDY